MAAAIIASRKRLSGAGSGRSLTAAGGRRCPNRATRPTLSMKHTIKIHPYHHPAGGWGSVQSLATNVGRYGAWSALPVIARQNKPGAGRRSRTSPSSARTAPRPPSLN